MKRIACEFARPLSWEEFKALQLPPVIAVTQGGSNNIYAFKCTEEELEEVQKYLQAKKIAVTVKLGS